MGPLICWIGIEWGGILWERHPFWCQKHPNNNGASFKIKAPFIWGLIWLVLEFLALVSVVVIKNDVPLIMVAPSTMEMPFTWGKHIRHAWWLISKVFVHGMANHHHQWWKSCNAKNSPQCLSNARVIYSLFTKSHHDCTHWQ